MVTAELVMFLIAVAYLIVLERKGLGMAQLRMGPNKVSLKGLLQPVADGVKLFMKEVSHTFSTSFFGFVIGPVLLFLLAFSLWSVNPSSIFMGRLEFGLLLFLVLSSCNVYGVFLCGWCCNSRYAMLGAMRGAAQVVSYEVLLSTILFCPVLVIKSFDLMVFREFWDELMLLWSMEIFLLWVVVVLAELNRTPFDFVEGESEIVSGYMVEYGGGGFALIALAEYSNILFMSMLTSVLLLGSWEMVWVSSIWWAIWSVFVCYMIILIRGTLPRYRYDLLMVSCWSVMLPFSLGALGLYTCSM